MTKYAAAGCRQFLTWILFTAFSVIACNTPPASDKKERDEKPSDTLLVETGSSALHPADTLVINQSAAVFFTADSLQREKLRAQLGENPFDGVDHECFYQMKNARTSLKEHWPQIRIYEVTDTLILLFLRDDGQKHSIDLRTKKDLCGLFLFNRKQDPVPADMMNIGTSLERYFIQ